MNNTGYLSRFEMLRAAYLCGHGVYNYIPSEPLLVMLTITVDYHAPLHLNGIYVTTGRTTQLGRTSFTMAYGVFVEGALRVEGTAVIILMAPDGKTGVPLSNAAREILVARDGAVPR